MRGGRIIAVLVLSLLAAGCSLVPFQKRAPEDCRWVTLTDEGDYCQAARGRDDALVSFYADMNGYALGEDVCVCGKPAAMSQCRTGEPLDISHLGRECPGPPPAF